MARAINQGLSEWVDKGATKNVYIDKYVYPFLYLKMDALRKQNANLNATRGAQSGGRSGSATGRAWPAITPPMEIARTAASGGGDSKTVSTNCVAAT